MSTSEGWQTGSVSDGSLRATVKEDMLHHKLSGLFLPVDLVTKAWKGQQILPKAKDSCNQLPDLLNQKGVSQKHFI